LRGISVAMYIVGQERRLVDPPSQVVAGVRTVTTKMDERCDAHVAALIRFFLHVNFCLQGSLRGQNGGRAVPAVSMNSRSGHFRIKYEI